MIKFANNPSAYLRAIKRLKKCNLIHINCKCSAFAIEAAYGEGYINGLNAANFKNNLVHEKDFGA